MYVSEKALNNLGLEFEGLLTFTEGFSMLCTSHIETGMQGT